MRRIRVTYEGRVQGVGFRMTCCSIARPARVTGWVRNEPDGTVLLEAQGDPAELSAVLDRIAEARASFIRSARAIDIDTIDNEDGFEIRR